MSEFENDYKVALREALKDGNITFEAREALLALQQQLGIDAPTAREWEMEVKAEIAAAQAEAARLAEEQRQAEEARLAEENARRMEQEAIEARKKHRRRILQWACGIGLSLLLGLIALCVFAVIEAQKDEAEKARIAAVERARQEAVKRAQKEAREIAEKKAAAAAEQKRLAEEWTLTGCKYYNGDGVAQDFKEAVKWFRKAADQGNAVAQCNLGVCYCHGQGIDKNQMEAVKWFRLAAERGNVGGQDNLGICYENGDGVAQDYAQAATWYRKAAEQGYAGAQYRLAQCYENGQGTPQDYAEAVKWLRKAADQGNAEAQCHLGACYATGQGVAQDYAEAVKWLRKAADQGNVDSQACLGEWYFKGQGVAQDYAEAVKWLRKAADQGNIDSSLYLGFCYSQGQGVAKDYEQAVKWYRKAADQGNANAQLALALCYVAGAGVKKDIDEAEKLYRKAAECSNQQLKEQIGALIATERQQSAQRIVQQKQQALRLAERRKRVAAVKKLQPEIDECMKKREQWLAEILRGDQKEKMKHILDCEKSEDQKVAVCAAISSANVKRLQEFVDSDFDEWKDSKLMICASEIPFPVVTKILLSCGASANETLDGEPWLYFAISYGNFEVAKLLIEKGADVNARSDGHTPLSFVCDKNECDAGFLKTLINAGADVNAKNEKGISAIFWAIKNNRPDYVRCLIQNGADLSFVSEVGTPLHLAAQMDREILEAVLTGRVNIDAKMKQGYTALHLAAGTGKRANVMLLMAHGADPMIKNDDGLTAPQVAFCQKHFSLAREMLPRGKSLNTVISGNKTFFEKALEDKAWGVAAKLLELGVALDEPLPCGLLPLHAAAQRNQAEAISYLLDFGADVNEKGKSGWTALHYAAFNNSLDAARVLLEKGAKINRKSAKGLTALHCAARKGHLQMVKFLVERGADVDAETDNDKTPYDLCDDTNCCRYLKLHMK